MLLKYNKYSGQWFTFYSKRGRYILHELPIHSVAAIEWLLNTFYTSNCANIWTFTKKIWSNFSGLNYEIIILFSGTLLSGGACFSYMCYLRCLFSLQAFYWIPSCHILLPHSPTIFIIEIMLTKGIHRLFCSRDRILNSSAY